MKTGTTYVQGMLYANRDALADAGVHLPGKTWGSQVRAVQDILGLAERDPFILERSTGAWARLLEEIRSRDAGISVVSMEFLSGATPRQARRVLDSLGWAEVHVVVTVRDTVRAMPAQWQTSIHNGATFTWPHYPTGARFAVRSPGPVARNLPNYAGRLFARYLGIPRT